MEIFVFADRAPAGMVKSILPSSLVMVPPPGPMDFVILVPTGVPIPVTAGGPRLVSVPPPEELEEVFVSELIFLQPYIKDKISKRK